MKKYLISSLSIFLLLTGIYAYAYTVGSPSAKLPPAYEAYAPESGAADQGVTDTGSITIKNLVDEIGTSKKATIIFAHTGAADTTTYTFTTSETIPSNIKVWIEPGAIIDGAGTLTINGPFEADDQCFDSDFDANFGDESVKEVYSEWWGAKADNLIGSAATNKTAIDSALATGKDVIFKDGTYYTTGAHRIATAGQRIYGSMNTTLKKSTGTNYMLDTVHGLNFIGIRNIIFDGNSLGGSQLIWRGHYSTVENISFKNQGGTSYAMYISGANLSSFKNIMTYSGCYGGILIDQSVDTYTPKPSYGCLYSTFDKVSIAQTNGGSALKLAGDQAQILNFKTFYFEDTQAAVPAIDIAGTNCSNINFYDLQAEPVILTDSLIKIDSTTSYNIHFIGGRLSDNIAQTELVFELLNVDGISIEGILFYDAYSVAGRDIIKLQNVKNGIFEGNICSFLNDFDFIVSVSGNEYITEKNNTTRDYATHPGTGTNLWNGTDHLIIENSEFTQTLGTATNINMSEPYEAHSQRNTGKVTVADDASYDIFGDGGSTSPGENFAGIISIAGGTINTTSENNVALLYIQSGSISGAQHCTSISAGSNIEVDVLGDDTAAALATTTDGKLGIQIGGGSVARRFIRIYNRTGASIELKVHVDRFRE